MNVEVIKQFVALTDEKRQLETRLEAIKNQLQALEVPIIDELLTEQIEKISVDGATVFVRDELWASCQDVACLKGCPDTAFMVKETVNGQTLSAWCRELKKAGRELPEEIVPAITVTEKQRLSVRRT